MDRRRRRPSNARARVADCERTRQDDIDRLRTHARTHDAHGGDRDDDDEANDTRGAQRIVDETNARNVDDT